MKQKMIIDALPLSSIFALAQTDDSGNGEGERRFWGRGEMIGYGDCSRGQQQADGNLVCNCTATYPYYVFWIEVGTVTEPYTITSLYGDC